MLTARLRVLATYLVPLTVTGCVILCGLWIVPDTMFGMYGNVDGKWISWNARGILAWSSFLDFGPYSPFAGTGSLFLPYLPWLNPGALPLSLPIALEYRHLLSYVVYISEFAVTLYVLFVELGIRRDYACTALLSYLAFFCPPFTLVSTAAPFFSLAPLFFHEAAGMNLATIALLRGGGASIGRTVVWSVVFVVALFSVFSSISMHSLTYVPVYGILWTLLAFSSRDDRAALRYRLLLLLLTAVIFTAAGVPAYVLATMSVSARDISYPPFLHPGTALLTASYWSGLVSRFAPCSSADFLACPQSPIGWVQFLALAGGTAIVCFERGRLRALAATVVSLILAFHVVYLLGIDNVLGRLQIVGYRYLLWNLFPLTFGVATAGVATLCGLASRHRDGTLVRCVPPLANSALACMLLLVFVVVVWEGRPKMAGSGAFGLPPIAMIPATRGPILRYLEERTALEPNSEFRGYVSLYLGADSGTVRKRLPTHDGRLAHATYVEARWLLANEFGNMFQLTDLWNRNIPTLEDYGQWLTKQMFVVNTDLFTRPEDADPGGVATHVYSFLPETLAMLGVRYVISDATLDSPETTEVLQETGPLGTTLHLYELRHANVGNLSPTTIVAADSYDAAVSQLAKPSGGAVLITPTVVGTGLVPADHARLTVIKGGYHVSAQSAGASLLALPVQYSHCWQLVEAAPSGAAVLRVNVVQTGIHFQRHLDADLKFVFGLRNSSCRRQDGHDMDEYFSNRRAQGFGSRLRSR